MAPKRRVSAAPSVDGKRRKLNAIGCAIHDAENYSKGVRSMLEGALDESLGIAKADRHSFQELLVGMVGEVLGSTENGLQSKIAAADSKFAEANKKNGTLVAAQEAATAKFNAKADAAKAAKKAFHDSETAVKDAKAAQKTAEHDQKEGDIALEDAGSRKTKLEEAVTNCFEPLKAGVVEGTAQDKAQKIKVMEKLAKEFSLESTLLDALPSALKRGPADRGTFDGFTIGEMEDALTKNIADLQKVLATGESAKTARQGQVDATTAAVGSATTYSESCMAASDQAHTAETEAREAEKQAKKDVHDFAPESHKAQTDLDHLKQELDDHQTGPMTGYKELVELANVLPPEPEATEEAATAAAA